MGPRVSAGQTPQRAPLCHLLTALTGRTNTPPATLGHTPGAGDEGLTAQPEASAPWPEPGSYVRPRLPRRTAPVTAQGGRLRKGSTDSGRPTWGPRPGRPQGRGCPRLWRRHGGHVRHLRPRHAALRSPVVSCSSPAASLHGVSADPHEGCAARAEATALSRLPNELCPEHVVTGGHGRNDRTQQRCAAPLTAPGSGAPSRYASPWGDGSLGGGEVASRLKGPGGGPVHGQRCVC